MKKIWLCIVVLGLIGSDVVASDIPRISDDVTGCNKKIITCRALDLDNTKETDAVCNLFDDQDIQASISTTVTHDEVKAFLALVQPGKKYDNWKVYVAQDTEQNVCGCMAYTIEDDVVTINPLAVSHMYSLQQVATELVKKLQDDHAHLTEIKIYLKGAAGDILNFFTQNAFTEFEKNKGMTKLLDAHQNQSPGLVNSNFEIKVVNKNDAQEIQSLADLFIDEEIQKVVHYTPKSILAQAQSFDDLVYIAKTSDGTVCGALMAMIDGESAATSSKMIICTIATHPQYRNQGIATQLMQKIEQVCLSNNLQRLELWVLADNEKAIRCYQKGGFIEFANSIGLIKKL